MISVNRLVFFAGPSGIGKTTLIQGLQEGRFPELAEQFELGDPSSWNCIVAAHLHRVSSSQMDCVFFHYDLTRPWRGHRSYEDEQPLGILDRANEITFVTLWATHQAFIQRRRSRQVSRLLKSIKSRNFRKLSFQIRLFKKHWQLYKNPSELLLQYDKWFKFSSRYNAKAHWIVNNTENIPQLLPLAQWPDLLSGNIP